jgi:HSP20 family protein
MISRAFMFNSPQEFAADFLVYVDRRKGAFRRIEMAPCLLRFRAPTDTERRSMPARENPARKGTSSSGRETDESTRSARERAERERSSTDVNVRRPSTGRSTSAFQDFGSPFGLMRRFSDEMSSLFDSFGMGRDFETTLWSPQVDVLRRGDNVVVRADLPGLSKDDITVDVRDNALIIRGERRNESEEEREGYYWHERSEGSFSRRIPLPEGADAERATARFENGVLEVSVPAPTREESRGRRIDIR